MDADTSATTPMKIIHCFRAPVGGLFRHVLDVANAQVAAGHSVGIFCDATTGGERGNGLLAELEPLLGLGLTRVAMRRNPHPSDLTAFRAFAALVARTRPDVVHCHGSKGGLYGRLPALIRNDGAIRAYTPHGGSFNYRPGSLLHRLYMFVEGLLDRVTDVHLFESEYIRDRFLEFVGEPRHAWKVVWNGLHPREFTPISPAPDARDLVYLGEFRPAKGIDTLIEALDILRRETGTAPGIAFVGSGPDEAAMRADLVRRGLEPTCDFHAPMPVQRALSLGRVMVVPSRAESLPYVILEAAGAAVPMIATGVGGVPEIFGPHSGRLIAPNDAPLLARAIAGMLAMSEAERGAQAHDLVTFVRGRFSVEAMCRDGLQAYREAIARKAARRS
jgi:glycosyltransferase involved in cell wall biosynthesis